MKAMEESKSVIDILMERDGLTRSEANEQVQEVRERIADCGYDYEEVEVIMSEELGLEMDYIFDLL